MRWVAGILVLAFVGNMHAQQRIPTDSLVVRNSDLDLFLDDETEDHDESPVFEEIADLVEQPVDLNTASLQDLQRVPGLSAVLAYRIVAQREKRPFANDREILTIDGITEDLFAAIRPFLIVRRDTRLKPDLRFRLRLQSELQPRKGFLENTFRGSRPRLYQRTTFTLERVSRDFRNVKSALVLEKDAGERWQDGHAAGYITGTIPALSTALLFGDFTVASGGGLVLGVPARSSSLSGRVVPSASGFRGYASTREDLFFRGVAFQTNFSFVGIAGFYSNRAVHASVSSDGLITRFDEGGIFRTVQEQRTRFTARERVVGGWVMIDLLEGVHISAKGYESAFDRPLALTQFRNFRGKKAGVIGAEMAYTRQHRSILLEAARDRNRSSAVIVGYQEQILRNVTIGVSGRSLPVSFNNRFGGRLSRNGVPENERGVRVWLRAPVIPKLRFTGTYDHSLHPEGLGGTAFPGQADDLLCLAEIGLTKRMNVDVRFRERVTTVSGYVEDSFGRTSKRTATRTQRNLRIHLRFQESRILLAQSRVEIIAVRSLDAGRQTGFLLSQSLRFAPRSWIRVETRFTMFETDSYDSRLYEFEPDVPGTFVNSALFGRGMKAFVLASIELVTMRFHCKYSVTVKEGAKSIGSGLEEIQGDLQNRISVQADIRF